MCCMIWLRLWLGLWLGLRLGLLLGLGLGFVLGLGQKFANFEVAQQILQIMQID